MMEPHTWFLNSLVLVWMRHIDERKNNYSYNYISMSLFPEYSLQVTATGCLACSSDNTKKGKGMSEELVRRLLM